MHTGLLSPYGGTLIDLMVPPAMLDEVEAGAKRLPTTQLSERAVCDLELLASGGFSPLDRFMSREDYVRVVAEMRLTTGLVFPIPVTFPVEQGARVHLDEEIALLNAKNELLAVMTVEEIYQWNRRDAARLVCGTEDPRHPFVAEMHRWGDLNISGQLRVLRLPPRYDFQDLRLTPRKAREHLAAFGRYNVVAFQTRNPLHRHHEELTRRAAEEVDGTLLLHSIVGLTKPRDVDDYTRVRTYKVLVERYFDQTRTLLSVLPLAMRMAGPREALWHAVIHRNYGANHLIIGRDHASAGDDSAGKPFYSPHEAQALVQRFTEEVGVTMVPYKEMAYLPEEQRFEEITKIRRGSKISIISGAEVRDEYLNKGKRLPDWFTRPEVSNILLETCHARHRHGVCLWFTGLSGAGKSTTAEVLTVLLLEHGRQVTLLDGDIVRTHLSKGLGFSREDRDTNIRRIGFVAAEIVRHQGVVVCAAVSPYRATRNDVRAMIGAEHFVEIYVNTPLEVCEKRDTKGLYAKARRGELRGLTGVDDPYEPPEQPDIILDTVAYTPEENARTVLAFLMCEGLVRADHSEEVSKEEGSGHSAAVQG